MKAYVVVGKPYISDDGYGLYVTDGFVHHELEVAKKEADRRARSEPGVSFIIMEADRRPAVALFYGCPVPGGTSVHMLFQSVRRTSKSIKDLILIVAIVYENHDLAMIEAFQVVEFLLLV